LLQSQEFHSLLSPMDLLFTMQHLWLPMLYMLPLLLPIMLLLTMLYMPLLTMPLSTTSLLIMDMNSPSITAQFWMLLRLLRFAPLPLRLSVIPLNFPARM